MNPDFFLVEIKMRLKYEIDARRFCLSCHGGAHAHGVARARMHGRARTHVQGRPLCIIDGLVLYDLASNQTALRGSYLKAVRWSSQSNINNFHGKSI